MNGRRHILSILVENRFGELCRIVGLFAGRGYNIDSLCVAPTPDPAFSKIVLTTQGNEAIIEQILKQVGKLVRVLDVTDLNEVEHVEREMALLIVGTRSPAERQEVLNLVTVFRGKVIDIAPGAITVEITGNQEKVEALVGLLKPLGIRDIVRTGPVAIPRIGSAAALALTPGLAAGAAAGAPAGPRAAAGGADAGGMGAPGAAVSEAESAL